MILSRQAWGTSPSPFWFLLDSGVKLFEDRFVLFVVSCCCVRRVFPDSGGTQVDLLLYLALSEHLGTNGGAYGPEVATGVRKDVPTPKNVLPFWKQFGTNWTHVGDLGRKKRTKKRFWSSFVMRLFLYPFLFRPWAATWPPKTWKSMISFRWGVIFTKSIKNWKYRFGTSFGAHFEPLLEHFGRRLD